MYNAPHAGSIKLDGGVFSCFIKCDYDGLEGDDDEEAQALVAKKEEGTNGVYQSPYQSPFMTPNTRAKREKERKAAGRLGKKITKVRASESRSEEL